MDVFLVAGAIAGQSPEQAVRRALDHGVAAETIRHASAHLAQVAGSRREAAALLRDTMPDWLATTADYVRIDARPPSRRDQSAYLDMLLSSHPIGSPAECADRLAASVAATGVHRVLLLAEAAGDPHRVRDNIDRLAGEVAPVALDR